MTAGALTLAETQFLRSHIAMLFCNLEEFHLYWLPSSRRVAARSTCTTKLPLSSPDAARAGARGRPPLPDSALYVGTYSSGALTVAAVLEDLEDLIGD